MVRQKRKTSRKEGTVMPPIQIVGCSLLIAASLAIIVYTLFRKSPVKPGQTEGEKTPQQIAAEEAAEDFKE